MLVGFPLCPLRVSWVTVSLRWVSTARLQLPSSGMLQGNMLWTLPLLQAKGSAELPL